VRQSRWDVRDIPTRIRELDRQLYSQTWPGVSNLRQWLPVFAQNPETWRAIVTGDGDLPAYWQTAVVDDELYFGLKSGALNEANLAASAYQNLSEKGTYNLYFVSICVNPRFRGVETSLVLIESFFSVIDQLASKQVFFKEVTSSACSRDGEQVCKTFRLTYVRDNAIGKIYSGSVSSVLDRFKGPLSTQFPQLLSNYRGAALV
jgi:hypothetical protein